MPGPRAASTSARSLSPRPGETDDDQLGVEVESARHGMRRLERRDDSLRLADAMERGQRIVVGRGQVLGPPAVAEERVLRADARIVEPGRDRVGIEDLAVAVGEDRRARAVQHARPARAQRGGARGLDADQAHRLVGDEVVEHADRVRAAADARDDRVGQPSLGGQHLLAGLAPDHALQLAHDLRVGGRADARADQVVRGLDVRDPVSDRLARRLLQRLRAELDGHHLGAEQAHPLDVRSLPAHVLGSHVDDALEAEARADGGGSDPVLAGARLGQDAALAEPLREHDLAERVVQLVRAACASGPRASGRGACRARAARRGSAASAARRTLRAGGRARRGTRDPPVPCASPPRARRAQGSASRARSARRRCRTAWSWPPRSSVSRPFPRAAVQARSLAWSFTPGSSSVDRAESTAHGRTAAIASATFSGPSPPASMTGPRSRGPARGASDRPAATAGRRRCRHARRRGAGRHRAPGGRRRSRSAGRGRRPSARSRRRTRRRAARCRVRRAPPSARRGLSARMKPTRSAPASTAASTSSWRVRPHTFTSGRRRISRRAAPGSGARMSVEPTRTAFAPASSAAAACARWRSRSRRSGRGRAARAPAARAGRSGRSRRSTRSRALTPITGAPSATARRTSSASCASTSVSRPSASASASRAAQAASSRSRRSSSAASAPASRASRRCSGVEKKPLASSGSATAARAARRSSQVPPKRSSTSTDIARAPAAS